MNSSRNNNNTTTATQRRRTSVVIIAFVASITASGIIILHMRASCNLDNYLKNDRHDLFIAPENMLVGVGAADTKESMIELDIDNACPRSSAINTKNNNSPPPNLMPLDRLQSIVNYWHEINCPQKETCQFASIGQHLLHIAMKRNQTLLTVQVGAMDGRSNDPMYGMFVETRGKNYVQARNGDIAPGRNSPFPDLRNWLPVMIEPVPKNYEDMKETYLGIANDKGLACAVPIHAAVSYEDSNKTSCSFCRFNTADDAPATCKGKPDWVKLQLGTLDCEHSNPPYKKNSQCILNDTLPCNSLVKLLADNFVPTEHIAMLQIDIEGYEYILLDGMFKEIPDESLPPVIHFEHKVMKYQDMTHPLVNRTSRVDHTKELLSSRGYHFYDEGEDYLALRLV
mmetsp:Transcript_21014/g.32043  ORF Transcript_21014/g.32043 Transcript_21014/m.32043 type:complete len:397 (+) Transcript_21014:69-1259(+)